MSKIASSVSSVGTYLKETENQYGQAMLIANNLLSSMEQMTNFVIGEKDKLEKQLIKLAQINETLIYKTRQLIAELQTAQEERDVYSEQYDNTEDFDELAYIRRRLEVAQNRLNSLSESYERSQLLNKDISRKENELQQLHRALSSMVDALQKNCFEVKKIITVLSNETNYNTHSLSITLNKLESYQASPPISQFGNYLINEGTNSIVSSGTRRAKANSKKKKIFKLKNGTLGFDSEGNRHLYHYYVSQAQPVKGILFDLMKGVSHKLRQAVIDELKGVIFLSARHGFNYKFNHGGKAIRIIGIDMTDPSYTHHLLMHVGHYIYEIDKSKEKLDMENHINYEITKNLKSADYNIRNMAMDFSPVKGGKSIYNENGSTSFKSAGSIFFSNCFKAYVSEDYDFLNAVKSNFGESYNAFSEIILKLSSR